jgi:hypothetical protein
MIGKEQNRQRQEQEEGGMRREEGGRRRRRLRSEERGMRKRGRRRDGLGAATLGLLERSEQGQGEVRDENGCQPNQETMHCPTGAAEANDER